MIKTKNRILYCFAILGSLLLSGTSFATDSLKLLVNVNQLVADDSNDPPPPPPPPPPKQIVGHSWGGLLQSDRDGYLSGVQIGVNSTLVIALIGLFTGRRPGDLSPLKAIRRSALEMISPREETYGWTVELLAVAAARKLTIAEVETGYRHRVGGQSKVSGTLSGSAKAGYRILRVLGNVGMKEMSPRARGSIVGAAMGILAVCAFSVWLLSDPTAGNKALASAWLLAWPVVLIAMGVGAAAGQMTSQRVGKRR